MAQRPTTTKAVNADAVRELALLLNETGLSEIEAANEWLRKVYLPAHNARFARPAALAESGFVRVADAAALAETLCIQEERVVDRANTVSWGRLKLQLPQSPLRAHYVKARVRVHQYPDASLAVFHGPRCIARFSADGQHQPLGPTCPSATSCSTPSRTLRAACGGGLRPVLTAAPPNAGMVTGFPAWSSDPRFGVRNSTLKLSLEANWVETRLSIWLGISRKVASTRRST